MPVPSTPDDLLEKLTRLGYLGPDGLKESRRRAASDGIPLLEAALLENRLHPDVRGWILAETLGLPFSEIEPEAVPVGLSDLLPEALARENLIVPISREGERLTIGVADPFRDGTFSSIAEMTGLKVRLVVCPRRTIGEILARLYPDPGTLSPEELSGGAISREEAEEWLSLGGARRVIEQVLLHGASRGMSGVRMYPVGRDVVIEGRGREKPVLLLSCPLKCRDLLFDAFRAIARVSADRSGLSEEVFHLESAAGVTAFRASFVRGLSGPEVTIKILPDLRAGIALDSVGLTPPQFDITQKVLGKGSGMFLVSAPGPEGGATTLYAMLRETHRAGARVVTVEEQHRFRNEGYIQLERRWVDAQFSGSYARLADSLEPDFLMVERVPEPADLVDLLHLAQSGVVVFCGIRRFNFDRTLRTLLATEVDPFILAHVTRLVMHQRLVKLLCVDCRRPVPARPSQRDVGERYREELEAVVRDASFFLPSGCPKCNGTGYGGKMALVELLPFTPGVQNIVASDTAIDEKVSKLLGEDFYSAVQSVRDLLRRGMIPYEDVLPFFR
jgi:type IV pilus assembly protein PilB